MTPEEGEIRIAARQVLDDALSRFEPKTSGLFIHAHRRGDRWTPHWTERHPRDMDGWELMQLPQVFQLDAILWTFWQSSGHRWRVGRRGIGWVRCLDRRDFHTALLSEHLPLTWPDPRTARQESGARRFDAVRQGVEADELRLRIAAHELALIDAIGHLDQEHVQQGVIAVREILGKASAGARGVGRRAVRLLETAMRRFDAAGA